MAVSIGEFSATFRAIQACSLFETNLRVYDFTRRNRSSRAWNRTSRTARKGFELL
jgi:hypothetical protein